MDNKINSIGVIFGEYVRIYEIYGARYLSLIITGEYENNLIGEYKSYTEGELKSPRNYVNL